ncbi:hypothetical protein B0H13DRAFT_2261824 [Mycena leptocephala]|nr:hypothetical protein B0H13DRAFT_2261824 [Mycena leptocephala]
MSAVWSSFEIGDLKLNLWLCEHVCLDWAWMCKDEDILDDEPHGELAPVEGLKAPAVCYVQREVGACCVRNFYLLSTGGGRARRTGTEASRDVYEQGITRGGCLQAVLVGCSSIHDSVSSKMSLTPPTSLPLPLTLLPASLLPSVARLLHPYVLAALLSHAPAHRFSNNTTAENSAHSTWGVDADAFRGDRCIPLYSPSNCADRKLRPHPYLVLREHNGRLTSRPSRLSRQSEYLQHEALLTTPYFRSVVAPRHLRLSPSVISNYNLKFRGGWPSSLSTVFLAQGNFFRFMIINSITNAIRSGADLDLRETTRGIGLDTPWM